MCLAQGHNTVTLVRLEPAAPPLQSSTLPLSHCAPVAQGHNTVTPVRLQSAAPLSRVKHSTNEPRYKRDTLLGHIHLGNCSATSLNFPCTASKQFPFQYTDGFFLFRFDIINLGWFKLDISRGHWFPNV